VRFKESFDGEMSFVVQRVPDEIENWMWFQHQTLQSSKGKSMVRRSSTICEEKHYCHSSSSLHFCHLIIKVGQYQLLVNQNSQVTQLPSNDAGTLGFLLIGLLV
jgi:hypothetical protein